MPTDLRAPHRRVTRWFIALAAVVLCFGTPSVAMAAGPATVGLSEITATSVESDSPRAVSTLRRLARRTVAWRHRRLPLRATSLRPAHTIDRLSMCAQWHEQVPPPWRGPPRHSVSVVLAR